MAHLIIAIHFDIDATDIESIKDVIEQIEDSGINYIKRVDLLNENDYVDNTQQLRSNHDGYFKPS